MWVVTLFTEQPDPVTVKLLVAGAGLSASVEVSLNTRVAFFVGEAVTGLSVMVGAVRSMVTTLLLVKAVAGPRAAVLPLRYTEFAFSCGCRVPSVVQFAVMVTAVLAAAVFGGLGKVHVAEPTLTKSNWSMPAVAWSKVKLYETVCAFVGVALVEVNAVTFGPEMNEKPTATAALLLEAVADAWPLGTELQTPVLKPVLLLGRHFAMKSSDSIEGALRPETSWWKVEELEISRPCRMKYQVSFTRSTCGLN